MILVKPSFEILSIMGVAEGGQGVESLQLIEKAGRTCYKSEDKSGAGANVTAIKFAKMILKNGHESVIEHSAIAVKFICDRGVTHELVRHRLASFSQESTRYVNYKGGCTFVIPPWVSIGEGEYTETYEPINPWRAPNWIWFRSMLNAERCYNELSRSGWSPQQARSVLPNSTKTEIVMTTNFREWRHIFELRCSQAAHPQMREIMIPLLEKAKSIIPVIFDDIEIDRAGTKEE